MKVLQINCGLNSGSTGCIAESIGNAVINAGGESYIAYGRSANTTNSHAIKIGSTAEQAYHLIQTRLFDNHGLASRKATHRFVEQIKVLQPAIIHLHNLHGYYINYEILFGFLKAFGRPVVWTFHDCWPFTGHCSYFDHIGCDRWQTKCYHCPMFNKYPASYGLDRSSRNYNLKRTLFGSIEQLTIVAVSRWLKDLIDRSFLKDARSIVIHNGVDLNIFKPTRSDFMKKYGIGNQKYILGVSNIWSERKGLSDFLKLRNVLNSDITIVLVGLTKRQINLLPPGIIGITRTNNTQELAEIYSSAEVFVNPSVLETFGLVTAEAMACGTPVVVYNTTASPELVYPGTGTVVLKHNINQLKDAVMEILTTKRSKPCDACRLAVEKHFNKKDQMANYLELYRSLISDVAAAPESSNSI